MDYALHIYFLKRLLISLAFLIPIIMISLIRKPISRDSVAYIVAGFLVGFTVNIVAGFISAYVIQLPLLPLHLARLGLPPQDIASQMFVYSMIFDAVYISSFLVSLSLAGYGIYRILKQQ